MKSRLRKSVIAVLVFLTMLFLSLRFMTPVYKTVDSLMTQAESRFLSEFSARTHLGISYDSLSPSLFSSIKIRNIRIFEIATGEDLLFIKNVVFRFNIFRIVSKDIEHAFSRLVISGVTLDADEVKISRIRTALSAAKKQSSASEILENAGVSVSSDSIITEDQTALVEKLLAALPRETLIKDVHLTYRLGNGADAEVSFGKLSLRKGRAGSFQLSCTGGLITAVVGSKGYRVGERFTCKGNVVKGFSGSSASLSLEPYTAADITLFRTQFLLRYADGGVIASSTQRILPYSLSAAFQFDQRILKASFNADRLNLLSVAKFPLQNERFQKIAATELTLSGSLDADLKHRLYNWTGLGNFVIPEEFVSGKERVSFDLKGNQQTVFLNQLDFDGALVTGKGKGFFNIPEKSPSLTFSIASLRLPNGNALKFNADFSKEGKDIIAKIASLPLGNQAFSSITLRAAPEKKAVPFSLSFVDGTRRELVGTAKISGVFNWGTKSQLSADLDVKEFFLESLARAGVYFAKKETGEKILKQLPRLKDVYTSDQLKFSTDFKHISFSIPSVFIADFKDAGKKLELSASGTDRAVEVKQLDVSYGNVIVKAALGAERAEVDNQVSFRSTLNVNGTPYELSGTYMPKEWFTLSGSYGIDILANLSNGASGSAKIVSLPLPVSKNLNLAFSVDTVFDVKNLSEYLVTIRNLQVDVTKSKLNRTPKLVIAGSVDPAGLIMDSVSFADSSSSAAGKGYALWNIKDGIVDSVSAAINLGNDLTGEAFNLAADFTNPLRAKLSKQTVLSDCYFSVKLDVNKFPIMRIAANQYTDDTFNGSLNASGTLENPYVLLNVENFSAQVGTRPVIMKGKAELVDGFVDIPGLTISWGNMKASDIKAEIDFSKFSGKASADFSYRLFGRHYVKAPLSLTVNNLSDSTAVHKLSERFIPRKFQILLDTPVSAKGIINGSIPLSANIIRDGNTVSFESAENLGIKGTYLVKTGTIAADVTKDKPLGAKVRGSVKRSLINLDITEVHGDFSRITDLVSTDVFGLYNGKLSGQVSLGGLTSDPILSGGLMIRDLDFALPLIFPEHLTNKLVLLTLTDNKISLPRTVFHVGSERLRMDANILLDRWSLDTIDANAETVAGDAVRVAMDVPKVAFTGDGDIKAAMHYDDNRMELKIGGNLSEADIYIQAMSEELDLMTIPKFIIFGREKADPNYGVEPKVSFYEAFTSTVDLVIDVDLKLGKHVNIMINPWLRALVAQGTDLSFYLDSNAGKWTIQSDVVLRGGQITYLSRNFYIKSGSITINDSSDSFNPFITARAVTRERDSEGTPVTIVFELDHQRLASFNPRIYSIPARSETEIHAMLGHIVSGDSGNAGSLFLSGLDYGLQLTAFKKFENALRDLFNFDIFSVRVNLLQNAVKYGINSNASASSAEARAALRNPVGNLLDNMSVYIGKYFSSDIYADALLQWTYNQNAAGNSGILGSGLVFRPEIGIELEAPFANIRWDFAPEFGGLQDNAIPNVVAATSLTLSWRFTF